jgi:hypothetical protein
MTGTKLILKRLSECSNLAELPFHSARHRKDRRFANSDRRQCHTYLAKDRRSGIADRRKRPSSIYSLAQFLRQKMLKDRVVFSGRKRNQYG